MRNKQVQISLPELALVGGTRALIGGGLGLLLADRLSEAQRKAVGWTCLAIGALSTIPLALEVLGDRRTSKAQFEQGKGEIPLRPAA
jgi:hypothetical protein